MKHLHDISCVFQGFQGVGAIYISGISIAKNVQLLQKHNIRAVICAARSGYQQYDQNIISEYLYIAADDNEQFNLSQYFLKAYDFIDVNRKKTNVLVHCMAGISRSATIILAYLIKKYGYAVDMILSLMKRKRPIIQPNEGFMIQLRDFSNLHNQKETSTTKLNFKRLNVNNSNANINGNQKKQIKNYQNQNHQHYHQNQEEFHSLQSRKIATYITRSKQKKRQLSNFSKQFLIDLKKQKIQRKSNKSARHINKFQEQMKTNSGFLQRQTKTEQLQSNFYSQQLGQELNVVQVKSEINVLSKQHLLIQLDTQTQGQAQVQKQKESPQKIVNQSISISEKLEKLKMKILKQYKKKSNFQLQNMQVQNEQEASFNVLLANKILRESKSRRICDKDKEKQKGQRRKHHHHLNHQNQYQPQPNKINIFQKRLAEDF